MTVRTGAIGMFGVWKLWGVPGRAPCTYRTLVDMTTNVDSALTPISLNSMPTPTKLLVNVASRLKN